VLGFMLNRMGAHAVMVGSTLRRMEYSPLCPILVTCERKCTSSIFKEQWRKFACFISLCHGGRVKADKNCTCGILCLAKHVQHFHRKVVFCLFSPLYTKLCCKGTGVQDLETLVNKKGSKFGHFLYREVIFDIWNVIVQV
jgi:hypothetical protein